MELRQIHQAMALTECLVVTMQPELMREIITIETFDRILRWLAIVSVPICLVAGLLWAKRFPHPRKWQLGALTGLLFGLVLPFIYALWRFYLWRIRIDLERGFVGLHRVDVLLGNLLIFTLIGIAVGVIMRLYSNWLRRQGVL